MMGIPKNVGASLHACLNLKVLKHITYQSGCCREIPTNSDISSFSQILESGTSREFFSNPIVEVGLLIAMGTYL